jgi:hypothetical protein
MPISIFQKTGLPLDTYLLSHQGNALNYTQSSCFLHRFCQHLLELETEAKLYRVSVRLRTSNSMQAIPYDCSTMVSPFITTLMVPEKGYCSIYSFK